MSRIRCVVASLGVTALALFSFAFSSAPVQAADAASVSAAANAATWLKTQQQSDGGFEVSGFPGFETRDAALAIAESAQTGSSWSTSQAHDALAAVHFGGGAGPTPLDALDAYAATITTAGAAAKTIVLSGGPLGLDPAAFDAAGDGSPVNLAGLLDSGCGANTASFGAAFSDTLYAILAKKLVCSGTPAAALATVRAAQQANGGWFYTGDPSGSDVDIDTTVLAVEALVAGGADASDAAVRNALVLLADNQQANGSWQAFGADDPNSTSLAAIGIAAAGFDPASSCWRDTVTPAKAGTAYTNPDAWLRSQQQATPPADAGRIASPNDGFGINTFATSQTVEGLLRSWLPITAATAQTCVVITPPPTTTPGAQVGGVDAGAAAPVIADPRLTG